MTAARKLLWTRTKTTTSATLPPPSSAWLGFGQSRRLALWLATAQSGSNMLPQFDPSFACSPEFTAQFWPVIAKERGKSCRLYLKHWWWFASGADGQTPNLFADKFQTAKCPACCAAIECQPCVAQVQSSQTSEPVPLLHERLP